MATAENKIRKLKPQPKVAISVLKLAAVSPFALDREYIEKAKKRMKRAFVIGKRIGRNP